MPSLADSVIRDTVKLDARLQRTVVDTFAIEKAVLRRAASLGVRGKPAPQFTSLPDVIRQIPRQEIRGAMSSGGADLSDSQVTKLVDAIAERAGSARMGRITRRPRFSSIIVGAATPKYPAGEVGEYMYRRDQQARDGVGAKQIGSEFLHQSADGQRGEFLPSILTLKIGRAAGDIQRFLGVLTT